MNTPAALKSIAVQMTTIDSELARLDQKRAEGKSLTSDNQDDAYRAVLQSEYRKLLIEKLRLAQAKYSKKSLISRIFNKK